MIPIRALWGLARSRRDTAAVKQRGFKSRDDGKTGIGEAANFIADQADGFTGLVGLGQRNILLIGNAEIVPDDMTLFDIESEPGQFFVCKGGKRIDPVSIGVEH